MKRDAQQLLAIAHAQADALARVRAAKRARRLQEHRRRLEQVSEASPSPWLEAVERDDRKDDRELEEQAA